MAFLPGRQWLPPDRAGWPASHVSYAHWVVAARPGPHSEGPRSGHMRYTTRPAGSGDAASCQPPDIALGRAAPLGRSSASSRCKADRCNDQSGMSWGSSGISSSNVGRLACRVYPRSSNFEPVWGDPPVDSAGTDSSCPKYGYILALEQGGRAHADAWRVVGRLCWIPCEGLTHTGNEKGSRPRGPCLRIFHLPVGFFPPQIAPAVFRHRRNASALVVLDWAHPLWAFHPPLLPQPWPQPRRSTTECRDFWSQHVTRFASKEAMCCSDPSGCRVPAGRGRFPGRCFRAPPTPGSSTPKL